MNLNIGNTDEDLPLYDGASDDSDNENLNEKEEKKSEG